MFVDTYKSCCVPYILSGQASPFLGGTFFRIRILCLCGFTFIQVQHHLFLMHFGYSRCSSLNGPDRRHTAWGGFLVHPWQHCLLRYPLLLMSSGEEKTSYGQHVLYCVMHMWVPSPRELIRQHKHSCSTKTFVWQELNFLCI